MKRGVGNNIVPHLLIVFLLAACALAVDKTGDVSDLHKKAITVQDSRQDAIAGNAFKGVPYSRSQDMAVVSVLGSKVHKSLKGFQRAVLLNAQGAVLKEVDISRSDSLYVLDKIIQANRAKGPLFIRMVK